MAASAADVRSILSLPAASTSSAPAGLATTKSKGVKKPEGISRELFALIGDSAPSLSAQLAKPRLKQKPRLGTTAAASSNVKWEWREFANGARTDGLRLSHWTKADADPTQEYPFTKYNVSPITYTYTDEEYSQLLEDSEWTKDETDYFFKLVHEYDMRWFVIYDRYEYPGGPPRQLEDLKERYFSVCRKLIRNRPWPGDEASKNQLLSTFNFDKEREMTRRKYLASLSTRTPAQIAEEEALYLELKRLEQTERRFRRERDDLLRTLLGVESGLPDLPVDEDPLGSGIGPDGKKRRRGTLMDIDSPMTPGGSLSIGAQVARRAQSTQTAKSDAIHCITRHSPPPQSGSGSAAAAVKTSHQPVYLRSYRLPVPKPGVAPKIAGVLVELGVPVTGPGLAPPPPTNGGPLAAVAGVLGISPAGTALTPRLVMPTRENCTRLERLVDAANVLTELKRVVDRTDQEIRVARTRLGIRSDGEAGEKDRATSPMDVGEDGESSVVDREQSVVSTRSGGEGTRRGTRARRSSRRSMSASSIETTATTATTSRKRARK